MTTMKTVNRISVLLGFAACCVANMHAAGYPTAIDLTTAGATGSRNGADFIQTQAQPTGSGYIDSFLRLGHGSPNPSAGYNTDVKNQGAEPLDNIHGNFTHSLDFSSLQATSRTGLDGITRDYYGFLLDINQSTGTGTQNLLSLNQVQIFRTDSPIQTADPNNATLAGAGYKIDSFLTAGSGVNLVYDMNASGNGSVQLNYDVGGNNSGGGSGNGDMVLWVSKSAFDAVSGSHVILYSQFGSPPGTYGNNDGYEEWAAFVGIPVPEPSTYFAGALLLIPVLVQFRRWKRAA